MSSIIDMTDIVKKFYIGMANELQVLHKVNITVEKGEFISIIGASGSGKSTLMNIMGALDRPTSGQYILNSSDISLLNDDELSDIRNKKIGFVFQTFNLIPRSSALQNVELPMLYAGVRKQERKRRAREMLELVEMEDRMSHLPSELSGGQKQRVAIARAMVNDPAIILADEPTGALDSKSGRIVMDIFHRLNRQQNKTIILITHNEKLANETKRIYTIKDGYMLNGLNEKNLRGAENHEFA